MTRRETWGDMARRAIKVERKPGDPVEFKHVIELSSRLAERDSQIIGHIWNELQCAGGEVKTLGTRVEQLEVVSRSLIAAHGNLNAERIARDSLLRLLDQSVKE